MNENEQSHSSAVIDLKLSQIDQFYISPGDIYWKKLTSKKLVKIISAGDILNDKNKQKLLKLDGQLAIEWKCSIDNIISGREILSALKIATKEEVKNSQAIKMKKWLFNTYWAKQNNQAALLDIIIVFETLLSPEYSWAREKLNQYNIAFLKRSLLFSSMVASLGLCLGYLDFSFIKDVYLSCLFADCSIENKVVSDDFQKSIDNYRLNLEKNDANDFDYLSHVKSSIAILKSDASEMFNEVNTINLIQNHHEDSLGMGVNKLNSNELSDLQGLIVLIEKRLSYSEIDFKIGDGPEFIYNLVYSEVGKLNLLRACSIIKLSFENIQQTESVKDIA